MAGNGRRGAAVKPAAQAARERRRVLNLLTAQIDAESVKIEAAQAKRAALVAKKRAMR